MAIYSFETITATQALAIASDDVLTFAASTGTASAATVIYAPAAGSTPATIGVTLGGRSVTFGTHLSDVSTTGHLTFQDGSIFYIGSDQRDVNLLGSADTHTGAMFGGDGNDVLSFGPNGGLLQGNQGNDNLQAFGSATIYGGQGSDTISGGGHDSFFQGNKGDDTISGGGPNFTLLGGQGDDTLANFSSMNDNAYLDGNLGNDVIFIRGNNDLALGEGGNDTITEGGLLLQTAHTISGGDGNDSIVAGIGADTISGDAGDDTIQGASSFSTHLISGGAGADHFLVDIGTTANSGGVPKILDWSGSEDSILFLRAPTQFNGFGSLSASEYASAFALAKTMFASNPFSVIAAQVGADVYVFAGDSHSGPSAAVELVGRSLNDIVPGHII